MENKRNLFKRSAQWLVLTDALENPQYNYQASNLGNIITCFGGRFISSKTKFPIVSAVFCLLILPCPFYCACCCPWLWHNVSPAIPIIFAYLYILTLSSFIKSSITDPGIIPRNVHLTDDTLHLPDEYTMTVMIPGKIKNVSVPMRYCSTCRIWRPPRTAHCRICDHCVENHDHHCIWLNTCIGRRNYLYFFATICAATLTCFLVIGSSLYQFVRTESRDTNNNRISLFLAIYCTLASIYPILLVGFHVMLLIQGKTTREWLRKNDNTNPYNMGGAFINILTNLCKPRGSPNLDMRAVFDSQDGRFEKVQPLISNN